MSALHCCAARLACTATRTTSPTSSSGLAVRMRGRSEHEPSSARSRPPAQTAHVGKRECVGERVEHSAGPVSINGAEQRTLVAVPGDEVRVVVALAQRNVPAEEDLSAAMKAARVNKESGSGMSNGAGGLHLPSARPGSKRASICTI